MKKEKVNVGFFFSLPVCIVLTYFLLPVGLVLFCIRLYKKGKITKRIRNITLGIIGTACIFVAILLFLPSNPADETSTPDIQPTISTSKAEATTSAVTTPVTTPATTPIENTVQKETDTSSPELETIKVEELSQYAGQAISVLEKKLDIEIRALDSETYCVEKKKLFSDPIELFRFTVDTDNRIVSISLKDSGKAGYTLCGVSTDMDNATAQEVLQENGVTFVYDGVWKSKNGTDAIFFDDTGWHYEKDSSYLQEVIHYAAATEAFTYQYEDSMGAYYIGNGQIIEYYHDSLAKFVYDYESLSAYQQSVLGDSINGRYIAVEGTVTGVDPDGKITVLCEDEDATEAAGTLLPIAGFGELYLTMEQESLLLTLSEGDEIVAFGRVDMSSYYSLLYGIFTLHDSIVLTIDGKEQDIPLIQTSSPGLTTVNKDGSINTELTSVPDDAEDNGKNPYYTTDVLLQKFYDNALQFETIFMNQTIELSGKINSIDNEGEYFTIESIYNTSNWDTIYCSISNVNQINVIAGKSKGDIVTICCKVTDAGDLFNTINVKVLQFVDLESAKNRATELCDVDEFWETAEWYSDEITNAYLNFDYNFYFEITAGMDSRGEVTYWLNCNASSEIIEFEGEYYESSTHLQIPAQSIHYEDNIGSVYFTIDGYHDNYSGIFELRKEFREDGDIVSYICVDIPGLLETNGSYLYVEKL